jgi:hypothetical protein
MATRSSGYGRMDVSNKGGQGFKKAIGSRRKYSRSNFIKCPASGAGKVRQPGLMSQVGRVAMSRARKSVCSALNAVGGTSMGLLA